MRRRVLGAGLVGVVLTLVLLTVGASGGIAKTPRCMIINDGLNTTYQWTAKDLHPVQTAIDAADPGATLWIRGDCPGSVEITKSLTLTGQQIKGFYYAPTIRGSIDGGTSVLHVSGSDVEVQINSLTLTRGGNRDNPVEEGGGISNERATLTLDHVTITGNVGLHGGGIYNDHGAVELTDSTIDSNWGGTPTNSGFGGGIYTDEGTVTLNSSTITNNQWAERGGGIYGWASTVVANGSEIAHNPGGPLNASGNVQYGGGIYTDADSTDPSNTLILTDTKIYDNFVEERGGGIYAVGAADVTLTGSSELSDNRAMRGGGAYVEGALVLSGNTKIHDNTALAYALTFGYGGGVHFHGEPEGEGKLTMSGNATIFDNTAKTSGGGIQNFATDLINCIGGTEGAPGVNVFNNTPDNIHTG